MLRKVLALALPFALYNGVQAQKVANQNVKTFRGQEVICPADFHDHFSITNAVSNYDKLKNLRRTDTKKSQFIVNYIGFSAEAREAFQRAVDTWEYTISSTVPIRVDAYWERLSANVLGSANTSDFYINFPGAKNVNTYYPVALAEKLAGKALNSDSEADIICRFNSGINWHYGNPEDIRSGYYDLTSTVLHELGHGIGFISTMRVSGSSGSYGLGTPYKSIFDVYIENSVNRNLVDTAAYKNNTNQLYTALTSNSLFFVDKSISYGSNNDKPKLYAPTTYSSGSSISHLDNVRYPSGTENALMSPSARAMEVNHHPGPVAMGIFNKMGWKSTSIIHNRLKNFSQRENIVFNARILSDTTLIDNSAKIVYRTTQGTTSQPLQRIGNTDEYTATITFPPGTTDVLYYMEVQDNFGETVQIPGTDGIATSTFVYSFKIGADNTPPIIDHPRLALEEAGTGHDFLALVEDDFEAGLSEVYVSYKVNNGNLQKLPLQKFTISQHGTDYDFGNQNDQVYLALNSLSSLRDGDRVQYQIIALDKSGNKSVFPTEYKSNSSRDLPVESFLEFVVTSVIPNPQSIYSNGFEANSTDFALVGFNIKSEEGFNSPALHSNHPYGNGLGFIDPANPENLISDFERNDFALLRYPLLLSRTSGNTITFDEVVLVEPGEAGAQFGGSGFFDYVVVEGTIDGVNWVPLEDGYDSRSNTIWQQQYNASLAAGDLGNSNAKGNVAMFKKRTISINSHMFGGDSQYNMLLRFRLYADQLSNGWGWAIDNLRFNQDQGVILANEQESFALKLLPNPTIDEVKIELGISAPQEIHLEVFAASGTKVLDEKITSSGNNFEKTLAVSNYAAGTYIVKITEQKGVVFKRFTKL